MPARAPTTNAGDAVAQLIDEFEGPSLSGYMADRGTEAQFLEFLMHRSAYQLKEADPHSLAIPRLAAGRRKSALVEIQADEYGGGSRAGRTRSCSRTRWRPPASTRPTGRMSSFSGRNPGHVQPRVDVGVPPTTHACLAGPFAVFEMTSVGPMGRYAQACERMGLPPAVRHFYDVHVEADDHHGRLARHALLGGEAENGAIDVEEVLFGAGALMAVEGRFTRHLLAAWDEGRRPCADRR